MKQSSLFSHIHLETIQRSMTGQSTLHVKTAFYKLIVSVIFTTGRFTRRVTFSRCAKNDSYKRRKFSHFFYIVLFRCKRFFCFFGSRARFGEKKCCEVLTEQEKAEVDLYITKFEKLRQNLRHRFSLNIYY